MFLSKNFRKGKLLTHPQLPLLTQAIGICFSITLSYFSNMMLAYFVETFLLHEMHFLVYWILEKRKVDLWIRFHKLTITYLGMHGWNHRHNPLHRLLEKDLYKFLLAFYLHHMFPRQSIHH